MDKLGSLHEYLKLKSQPTNRRFSIDKSEPPMKMHFPRLSARDIINVSRKDYDTSRNGYYFDNSPLKKHHRIRARISEVPIRSIAKTSPKPPKKSLTSGRREFKSKEVEIDKFEADIRSELLMKPEYYLLKLLKRHLKDTTKIQNDAKSTYEVRFKSLARAVLMMGKGNSKALPPAEVKSGPKITVLSSIKAQQLKVNGEAALWLSKRGSRKQKDSQFEKFAKAFFDVLDTSHEGILAGESLLTDLLGLGIATEPKLLEKTLCILFKKNSLKSMKIRDSEFKALFKSDRKTDHILWVLNNLCLSNRTGENTGVVTISEHQEMLNKIWKSLNKYKEEEVNIVNVAYKLVDIKVAQDFNDAKTLITGIVGSNQTMCFDHFQEIFAKSMFKGALSNLAKRLATDLFAPKELPVSYRIESYKRSLLMSGINCPSNFISVDEGVSALNAMNKYRKNIGKPLHIGEFHDLRERILNLAGISVEEADRKAYLIKHGSGLV